MNWLLFTGMVLVAIGIVKQFGFLCSGVIFITVAIIIELM